MSDARTPDPGLRQRIVVSKHVLENWIVPTLIAGVFLTLRGHSFGVKNANVREAFRRNLASRSGTGGNMSVQMPISPSRHDRRPSRIADRMD
jgi:hypothetical protein